MDEIDPADALPVVTQAEFDKIECNRCGACCEALWLDINAVEHPEQHRWADQEKMERWLKALVPTGKPDLNGQRQFSCSLFARDSEGLGVCTIYEDRPHPCSMFPYGRPVDHANFSLSPTCSWAVQIVG